MIRRTLIIAALAVAGLGLAACDNKAAAPSAGATPTELTFSILSAENQTSMQPLWQPLLDDMSAQIGVKVKPYFATNYTSLVEAMRFKQVQMGWFSAAPALQAIKPLSLLTAKPVLFIANVKESELKGNAQSAKVAELAAQQGAECVVICAALEAELAALADDEQAQFLAELGVEEAGLNRVIRAGYHLLGLQTYFTAGPKECRAWTFPHGATAPQAAAVIHTDFERGFIRAEVIAYDDFIAQRGEAGAQSAGKLRLEGKEYIVKDGDVMHFRFNV